MGKISTGFSLCLLLALMTAGSHVKRVGSDFAKDQQECQEPLSGLAPCIPYISEVEKSVSPVCCLKLGINFDEKRKCMCMLVRDRNDPGLGFKVNATLALSLPFLCHIPANETQCLDFLHLDPRSPDAQVFLQFSNSSAGSGSSSSSSALRGTGSSTPSASPMNHGKKLLNLAIVVGVSVWLLMHVKFH